jgi:hypothetical protein
MDVKQAVDLALNFLGGLAGFGFNEPQRAQRTQRKRGREREERFSGGLAEAIAKF